MKLDASDWLMLAVLALIVKVVVLLALLPRIQAALGRLHDRRRKRKAEIEPPGWEAVPRQPKLKLMVGDEMVRTEERPRRYSSGLPWPSLTTLAPPQYIPPPDEDNPSLPAPSVIETFDMDEPEDT